MWIVNDDRVLASVRRLVIAADGFDYRLEMSLRTHPAARLHMAEASAAARGGLSAKCWNGDLVAVAGTRIDRRRPLTGADYV